MLMSHWRIKSNQMCKFTNSSWKGNISLFLESQEPSVYLTVHVCMLCWRIKTSSPEPACQSLSVFEYRTIILNLLQSVEHLSWLGLFKDLSEGTPKPSPFYHKRTLHKTRKECEHVREKFLQMRHVTSTRFFFFSRVMGEQISRITDAWTVTFAAPWRYQRRWDSTWRRQPLTTGMTLKRIKRPINGGIWNC